MDFEIEENFALGSQRRKELIELELDEELSFASSRLIDGVGEAYPPRLTDNDAKLFECHCKPTSIDEQRDKIRELRRKEAEKLESPEVTVLTGELAPNQAAALRAFGPLSRANLAKALHLNRIRRRQVSKESKNDGGESISSTELALYTLERLVFEANASLAMALTANHDTVNYYDQMEAAQSVIKAPIKYTANEINSWSRNEPLSLRLKGRIFNSQLWSQQPGESANSDDSGVDLIDKNRANTSSDDEDPKWPLHHPRLMSYLEFSSNVRIQRLVSDSILFFAKMIEESPLFGPLQSKATNYAANDHNSNDGRLASTEQQQGKELFSSQELKLYVCVEAQKLRSAIRFTWLSICLELVFGCGDVEEAKRSTMNESKAKLKKVRMEPKQDGLNPNPPINVGAIKHAEDYYDQLALIMGRLLREAFLVLALERWCQVLEAGSGIGTGRVWSTNRSLQAISQLSVQVDTLEIDSRANGSPEEGGNQKSEVPILTCSQPNEELKSTMSFVVDELARVCENVPRLETLLESTRQDCERALSNELEGVPKIASSIRVLQTADDLLVKTKQRINNLIDNLEPIPSNSDPGTLLVPPQEINSQQGDSTVEEGPQNRVLGSNQAEPAEPKVASTKWLHPSYLLIIELVNMFRLGVEPDAIASSVESFMARHSGLIVGPDMGELKGVLDELRATPSSYASGGEAKDSRILNLRSSSQLMCLLDQIDKILKCQLKRYFDFGFVLLDCGPLRRSLSRCLYQERRLITRMKLDELLKLMERLRLQFDEIELAIDLESTIEDYLIERAQAKQVQPNNGHLLLAGDDDDDEDVDDNAPDREAIEAALVADGAGEGEQASEQEEILGRPTPGDALGGEKQEGDDGQLPGGGNEEDELLIDVLNGGMGPNGNSMLQQQQLLALVGSTTTNQREQGNRQYENNTRSNQQFIESLADRQVAPLVECRLLVEKYNYLSNLLSKELAPLIADMQVFYEGLSFLSEFIVLSDQQLEPTQSELITDLALRSRQFDSMITASLKRLSAARSRLVDLNALRSRVLSKLVLEFHQLAATVSKKTLQSGSRSNSPRASPKLGGAETNSAIGQLDSIQETSSWAQKLKLRNEYLERQNSILAKELQLLQAAKLDGRDNGDFPLGSRRDNFVVPPGDEYYPRASVLASWRPLVEPLASVWALAEEFETLQVKWLNSDTKRLNFVLIQSTFDRLSRRLGDLRQQLEADGQRQENLAAHQNLVANLRELERRLEMFERRQLPVFKFLANGHLTASHWSRVAELSGATGAVSAMAPQMCTTVAQLLELNVDQFVEELERINRQATVEHELTMFLLAEVEKSQAERELQGRTGGGASWLAHWTDDELTVAAERFLEIKLNQLEASSQPGILFDCQTLARKIVGIHSTVKRHLKLGYTVGLDPPSAPRTAALAGRSKSSLDKVVLRPYNSLSNANLVQPALFVELLRLFTEQLIGRQEKLAPKSRQLQDDIGKIKGHMEDLGALVDKVRKLEQTELKLASRDIESILARLERDTMALELERETLATKEALALDRQREALKIRDDCIRQITERAIPALRAATKALDCLDDKCLQTLRSLRPSPPMAVRLVLEAVCLLRSCSFPPANSKAQRHGRIQAGANHLSPVALVAANRPLTPERRFDALAGRVIEDYWPVANRMLNGTHSVRFVADLRRVDKRSIPSDVMRLIRRRYLSNKLFDVRSIEQVSRESALLAKWLIAVDVFDRVINVVKPNYRKYVDSERKLGELIGEVTSRGRQIDSVGMELQRLEDSFSFKVANRASLVELLAECKSQLAQVEATRVELALKQNNLERKLRLLQNKQRRLANRCLLGAAKLTYVDGAQLDYREPMTGLLLWAIRGVTGDRVLVKSC